MKILVSGFQAFGGETVNPTHKLIDELSAGRIALPAGVTVESVLLPVGFQKAFDVLKAAIDRFQPQAVLSLGQAGGRANIEIERVAVNMMDAEIPDNDGWQPRDQHIVVDGMAAYFSSLPLRKALHALENAMIPARISNSAGLYVCNFLFYKLQELASSKDSSISQSGFVHFPYLVEQAEAKNAPSMHFTLMTRALEVLLETIAMP